MPGDEKAPGGGPRARVRVVHCRVTEISEAEKNMRTDYRFTTKGVAAGGLIVGGVAVFGCCAHVSDSLVASESNLELRMRRLQNMVAQSFDATFKKEKKKSFDAASLHRHRSSSVIGRSERRLAGTSGCHAAV